MILVASSCQIDERIDDLTGGYEGVFIDKVTGDTVCTEYFGAKVKLLDAEYGKVAQPLVYNVLPDGTFRNTKVYPSKYKVWGEGPFLQLDTVYGNIKNGTKLSLKVLPNMSLKILNVELKYGVELNVTYCYNVNDLNSSSQEVGIVYSKDKYPGQRNAVPVGTSGGSVFKSIKIVTEKKDTITEKIYLEPNQTYYIRALGHSENAGDYWNYSTQILTKTGNINISELPVSAKFGVVSATSAIIQWSFPPVVDGIKLTYKDMTGKEIVDILNPKLCSYVANLAHNTSTEVKVNLLAGNEVGPDKIITVKTEALSDKYVEDNNKRAENVPFFNDENMKYSISKYYAEYYAPVYDLSWTTSPYRYQFIDWWASWLAGTAYEHLPTNQEMENFTSMNVYGAVKTFVDLLPCINLETLTIEKGDLFSTGEVIDPNVDLNVLKKLPNLKKVILGKEVPLSKDNFTRAGLTNIQIIKN